MASRTHDHPIKKPVVIYVPGLYGSTLSLRSSFSTTSSTADKDVWNLPSTLLWSLFRGNRGHLNLSLPITWSMDHRIGRHRQEVDDIYASDCLYQSQSKLLDFFHTLRDHDCIELHKIPWDWRRGLEEAEADVRAQIASICGGGQQRQAILVTHSTGAMLSWPSVNQNPQWFKAWISVAGCITGGSNIFHGNLRYGWDTPGLGMIKLLGKEALFSFPTLVGYQKLPGEMFLGKGESDFVSTNENGEYKYLKEDIIDLYDVKDWEKYHLGIFGWKGKKNVTEVEKNHLRLSLASAKRFRETHFVREGGDDDAYLVHQRNSYDHIRIICYGSESDQTHSAYSINPDSHEVDVSKSYLTAPGDGTLWKTDWTSIPGKLSVEIILAEEGSTHASMINDGELLNILMKEFFSEEGSGILTEATNILNEFERDKLERKKSRNIYCSCAIVCFVAFLFQRVGRDATIETRMNRK